MTQEQAKTLSNQLDAACKAARRMTRSTSAAVGKRWCEGCQAYHRLSAFDEAFTGRTAKGGRVRLRMRCRAWHKAHPPIGVEDQTECVLCGRGELATDEQRLAHYAAEHPERAGDKRRGEILGDGFRAPKSAAPLNRARRGGDTGSRSGATRKTVTRRSDAGKGSAA